MKSWLVVVLVLFKIFINALDNGVDLANLQVALNWSERLKLLEDGMWAGWRNGPVAGMD